MKKLAVLLLAPFALAACGGGLPTAQVNVDPVAYVKQAAQKTGETSAHMSMTARMDMGPMSLSMDGSGDFSYAHRVGSIAVNASIMGQDVKVREIVSRTTIYMSSPLFSMSLPAGKKWVKIDLGEIGKAQGMDVSSLLSQSPSQNLQRLEAAGKVSKMGSETIDGVATTHYRVTELDISKLPGGAKLGQLGKLEYGPIDVWIGDANGYVYRQTMSVTYGTGANSGTMTMTVNLSKFGEAVHVTVPPARQTVDAAEFGLDEFGA